MAMVSTRKPKYDDNGDGTTRRSAPTGNLNSTRHIAGPMEITPVETFPLSRRPLVSHPAHAQRASGRIPRAREDWSLADVPTSLLRYPQSELDWRVQPLGPPEGGRQMYNIQQRCRPGVAGFHGMEAELNSGGGGNLYRIWTISGQKGPETPPPIAFPISGEQIICLLPASMHARLSENKFKTFEIAFSKLMDWALADTPDTPDKEGA
jgi:hypothetical protein